MNYQYSLLRSHYDNAGRVLNMPGVYVTIYIKDTKRETTGKTGKIKM